MSDTQILGLLRFEEKVRVPRKECVRYPEDLAGMMLI